ncbi:MAG: DUF2971 domain-containing protein, partial [Pseudomonadales bacterium]|nr:DUF2971 domain-containing protein [Pseudomonadales bacterium]
TDRRNLNDPFEVRPSFSSHAEYVHEKNKYGDNVDSVVEEMKNNQWYVLEGMAVQDFDMYGILSLTEKNDHLMMWSHYADQHKGLVIGLDPNHSFFDAKESKSEWIKNESSEFIGKLRPVKYKGKRPRKVEDLNEYYFWKSNDWWREREWRYVLPTAEADCITGTGAGEEIMAFYSIPSESIVSITCGLKMKWEEKTHIAKKLSSESEFRHVRFYEAAMCGEEYELIIEEILPKEFLKKQHPGIATLQHRKNKQHR